MTNKISKITFKANEDINTYLKSRLGSSMLYLDFSKSKFGFGEISIHQNQEKLFTCMNEMMPRELCADIALSFLMSLPKEETLSISIKKDAWEHLDIIDAQIDSDFKKIFNKYVKRKDKPMGFPELQDYIPALDFKEIKLNKENNTISAVLKISEKEQNFYTVVIDLKHFGEINYFSPFYEKTFTVSCEMLDEMLDESQDLFFISEAKVATCLTAFFYKKWLAKNNKDVKDFVKSLDYHHVSGKKMIEREIIVGDLNVQSLNVDIVSDDNAFFAMDIVTETGEKHTLRVVPVKDSEGYSVYALNVSNEEIICNALAKVLGGIILLDQEHMDYRALEIKFDNSPEVRNFINTNAVNIENGGKNSVSIDDFSQGLTDLFSKISNDSVSQEDKDAFYKLVMKRVKRLS